MVSFCQDLLGSFWPKSARHRRLAQWPVGQWPIAGWVRFGQNPGRTLRPNCQPSTKPGQPHLKGPRWFRLAETAEGAVPRAGRARRRSCPRNRDEALDPASSSPPVASFWSNRAILDGAWLLKLANNPRRMAVMPRDRPARQRDAFGKYYQW